MKITTKKYFFFPIILICFLLCSASFGLLYLAQKYSQTSTGESLTVFNAPSGYATIIPVLLDSSTNLPIENGIVCIPEANIEESTQKNGKTPPLRVPILKDTRYDSIQEKPWGELLLLIYAEGYTPTIYICTEIYQDMELQGPTIYMQKQKSDEIQYIFDEPNLYWAKELIKKYTPES